MSLISVALYLVGCGSSEKHEPITEAGDQAPVITSNAVITVQVDTDYHYMITTSDADNDTVSLTAIRKPDWLTFDAITGTLSGQPGIADLGDHHVNIRVSDSTFDVDQEFTLTVQAKLDKQWQLVWHDEFEGNEVDPAKWGYEVNCWGGGNNEQQCYTDRNENSVVTNGLLTITAQREDFTGADNPDGDLTSTQTLPYTSARLRTKGNGDWKYGRFEIRAKLPQGQGSWPAIWMLPTDWVYGGWPNSGEIDIMEAVNLKVQGNDGKPEAHVHGTLHYGRQWPENVSSGQAYLLPDNTNPADDFHTYAVEWEKTEIRWYVDDVHFATHQDSGWYTQYDENGELVTGHLGAPFDQKFHLLLNLAVGGNWAANVNNTGIDETAFPQTMEVDFVRVFECAVSPEDGEGCATIDENAALITGDQAPDIPPPVIVDPDAEILVVFDDEDTGFIAGSWIGDGGNISISEVDVGGDRHKVKQFTFNTEQGVAFFQSDNNTSDISAFDNLEFDVFLITDTAAEEFFIKMDCIHPCSTGDIPVGKPPVGEWFSYSLKLADMAAAGLDTTKVNTPLVFFPSFGAMAGFDIQLDNIRLTKDASTEPPADGGSLQLYADGLDAN